MGPKASAAAVDRVSAAEPTARVSLSTPANVVRHAYQEHGYVVLRNVLPDEPIDRFTQAFETIKQNPYFVYYSQSLQRCMRPSVSERGYLIESMQNASRLALHRDFARTFQDCIYHQAVARALSLVSGAQQHVSWQNMLFDQSTGTVEHQDSWYLDTDPPGQLMGVWYALEDIEEGSGPFFVCPRSHKLGMLDRAAYPEHRAFVAAVRNLMGEHSLELEPCLLRRGDVLIWHPYLVHGALTQTDAALSRKSFTSHFYPRGSRAKDTESKKLLSIYDHASPRPTRTPDLFTAYRFPDVTYNGLVYAKFALDALRSGRACLDMGRRAYSDVGAARAKQAERRA
jgi:phytanoyl-CoA hydroxylase